MEFITAVVNMSQAMIYGTVHSQNLMVGRIYNKYLM